ncbi:MAG TPA: EF-hand domain-containing protein, partial [Isosphaeraceae bacterium]|nr:EF-hand domain-containing protein [Isosphaeraceae bacterium]
MKNLLKGMSVFGIGLMAAGTAVAQVTPAPVRPAAPAPGAQPAQAAPATSGELPAAPAAGNNARIKGVNIQRRPGDLPGPIDSFHDVQDSLKMAFMAADQNHDGLISQKEATDAGNMLVGGLFFSADGNGDGVVSKEEAQSIR